MKKVLLVSLAALGLSACEAPYQNTGWASSPSHWQHSRPYDNQDGLASQGSSGSSSGSELRSQDANGGSFGSSGSD